MNLFDQVSADIKEAMLAKDKIRLQALRGVKKEFLEAKTAKGGEGELSDEAAVKILQKMIKQRKESAEIYTTQGRPELAQDELAEAASIEVYLPKQMSAEELEAAVKAKNKSLENIRDLRLLVQNVTKQKIEAGQLRDVDFTMREMAVIESCFIEILRSTYHSREVKEISESIRAAAEKKGQPGAR